MNNDVVTDGDLYGQIERDAAAGQLPVNFCPYLLIVCMCWMDGECKAGKCLYNNIQRTAESGQE